MQQIKMDAGEFTALFDKEAKQLANSAIGFVVPNEGKNEDGRLGGSGTLVSIDGVEGILTAEHVVRDLRKRQSAGIILCGYREGEVHQFGFDTRLCQDFSYCAQAGRPADGPDLSFLVLPPNKTASLKARKTFYNLSKRRDAMLDNPPSRELGVWAIYGLADEWTKLGQPQKVFQQIKAFHGRLLVRWSRKIGQEVKVYSTV